MSGAGARGDGEIRKPYAAFVDESAQNWETVEDEVRITSISYLFAKSRNGIQSRARQRPVNLVYRKVRDGGGSANCLDTERFSS